jgi:tetratricopeptide (TPR) repeat protein
MGQLKKIFLCYTLFYKVLYLRLWSSTTFLLEIDMKIVFILFISMLAATLALPGQSLAAAPATGSQYARLAQQAEQAHPGHNRLALFYLERALAANVGDMARFRPLEGRYWALVGQTSSFADALNFYARLKAQHPDNPEVLANYANAIGGVLGWLHAQNARAPRKLPKHYNREAMSAYAKALKLDPDNFSALLGRSIYLSYRPGKLSESEAGFKHILSLRKSHPHYPYAMVYKQWAAALKRHGKKARAEQILKQGHAKLGDAAFKPQRRQW